MLVIIIVAITFYRKAEELNLNKVGWAAIGVVAYFLTQVILGIIAALIADMNGTYIDENNVGLNLIGIALAALVCVALYYYMPTHARKKAAKNQPTGEVELLDDDIFIEKP